MKYLINCAALLMIAAPVMAEEEGCPAAAAAELGYTSVEAFHLALMPLWHVAWPERDMKALKDGASAFDSLYGPIEELKPTIGNKKRLGRFQDNRAALKEAIAKYLKAAESDDSETLYNLLPGLHNSYEAMASALPPTPFIHFEGLVVTSDIILKKHLPQENIEGITGSTETLVMKLSSIDSTMIPKELLEQKEEILQSFAKMTAHADLMKNSCDKKEMEAFSKQAVEFGEMLKQFSAEFL